METETFCIKDFIKKKRKMELPKSSMPQCARLSGRSLECVHGYHRLCYYYLNLILDAILEERESESSSLVEDVLRCLIAFSLGFNERSEGAILPWS